MQLLIAEPIMLQNVLRANQGILSIRQKHYAIKHAKIHHVQTVQKVILEYVLTARMVIICRPRHMNSIVLLILALCPTVQYALQMD